MCRRLTGFVVLAISSAVFAAGPLDAPCHLDVRSTPFRQTLDQLTARLGIPYVMDSSVMERDAQKPIRLFAEHLTGWQAIRWQARLAELEAVLIEGTVFVARQDRLPFAWRNSVILKSKKAQASDAKDWQSIRLRQADIQWMDAPLSLLARDVSSRFGIDIIFHTEILKKHNLIHLACPKMRLDSLCKALQTHLDAEIEYLDGAIWAHPRNVHLASQPAPQKRDRLVQQAAEPTQGDFWARQVVIDRKMTDWQALGDVLGSVIGLKCRMVVPPGVSGPDWDASGSATDILEAGKLLGRLNFQLKSDSHQKPPVLLIQVRPIGR